MFSTTRLISGFCSGLVALINQAKKHATLCCAVLCCAVLCCAVLCCAQVILPTPLVL